MPLQNGERQKLLDLERRVTTLENAKVEVIAERVAGLDWRINEMDDRFDKRFDTIELKQESQGKAVRNAAVTIAFSAVLFAGTTFALLGRFGG
jgi:hypothetical protein